MGKTVAIIGSGSSIVGYLFGLRRNLKKLPQGHPDNPKIIIIEKSQIAGSGLPYDPKMTSPEHLINVKTLSFAIPYISADATEERKDKAGFFEWLQKAETQKILSDEFKKIFFERFKRAYRRKFGAIDESLFEGKNIFDPTFNESEFFKRNQDKEGFVEFLKYHQKKFETYVAKVESDSRNAEGFLPRIVYGFYSKALFDYQVTQLKELIGAENVEVRCESEVVEVKKISEERGVLTIKKDGEFTKQEFDHAFVAAGLWQEEQPKSRNPSYIQNIWPSDLVEEKIAEAIKKAKAEGKKSIKIAIQGMSLSAVDMMRTCFKDGAVVDGIRIEVDMVSRNARFQKVKGNFRWLIDECAQYFPSALEKVMKERGLDFVPIEIPPQSESMKFFRQIGQQTSKIIAHEAGKKNPPQIHIWQVLDIFLDLLKASYEINGLADKASAVLGIKEATLRNRDNYQATLALLKSLESPNPFEQLKLDFAASQKGDLPNHDFILEHIYQLFSEAASYTSLLPQDEKLFLRSFKREFLGPMDAAMPPESADDLLRWYEAGNLNVRRLGRGAKVEMGDDGPIKITDSDQHAVEYDLVINAAGSKAKASTTSPLLTSIQTEFGSPLTPTSIKILGIESEEGFKEKLREKFGREYADEMIKSGKLTANEDEKTLTFESQDPFLSLSNVDLGPLKISRGNTGSIVSSVRSGQLAGSSMAKAVMSQ